MQKLRVGVLMGGKSLEKEISFLSGRTICDHLDTARYDVIPLFQTNTDLYVLPWYFLHRGKITDFEHRLVNEAEKIVWDDLKKRIDFVYIAQHGRYAEDGILQGLLEVLGIPYLGSGIFASAIRVDKIIQKLFLTHAGIKTPTGIVVHPYEIEQLTHYKEIILKKITDVALGNEWVVKPYNEGSSLGVSVLSDCSQLEDALRYACFIEQGKKKKVLIEEKIKGMEFTCIIITDKDTGQFRPLPPTEIMCETDALFFDYEQKYMPGRGTKITPARCSDKVTEKIQKTCIAVMEALEIETIGRIDGFVTEDEEIIIIDTNTLSGMAPSSFVFNQAAQIGMSQAHLINYLIETEMIAYGMEQCMYHTEEDTMNSEQKMRVAVLFGGKSHEKEISLESGRNVFYKLSTKKYQPIPLFVSSSMELYHVTHKQIVHNSTQEIERELTETQKIKWSDLPALTDFVFIALHGGEGENGSVQGMLEMLGMPYNGSSIFASSLCMNKFKTTEFLLMHGFDVPRNRLVLQNEWNMHCDSICSDIVSRIQFPCIVKPHDDGCSVMVKKVETIDEFKMAVDCLFSYGKKSVLIEEFINGMELTVGVIGNDTPHVMPPSQAVSTKAILTIEEKFLPGAGENQTPAPLQHTALNYVMNVVADVYKAVQCRGYARIDCFYQAADMSQTGVERVIVLEINTLPGLTPATCLFHQAAEIGFRPMEFIDEIIKLGCQEHASQFFSCLATTRQIAPLASAAKKHQTDANEQ